MTVGAAASGVGSVRRTRIVAGIGVRCPSTSKAQARTWKVPIGAGDSSDQVFQLSWVRASRGVFGPTWTKTLATPASSALVPSITSASSGSWAPSAGEVIATSGGPGAGRSGPASSPGPGSMSWPSKSSRSSKGSSGIDSAHPAAHTTAARAHHGSLEVSSDIGGRTGVGFSSRRWN